MKTLMHAIMDILKHKGIPALAWTFLFLTGAEPVQGQDPLKLEEIRVVAPYEPTISDAFKINLNPRLEDPEEIRLNFDYRVEPVKLVIPFVLEPISPARMRGEPLTKLYRGIVKGGYGSYSTPFFEGHFNSLRSNRHALGVHLRHLSSGGGIEEVEESGYSDNLARLYGKKFLRSHTLEGDVRYERNMVHQYGIRPDLHELHPGLFPGNTETEADDIRQVFNRFSSELGFGSHRADSTRLRQQYRAGYHWLFDRYDAGEHHAWFRGHLGSPIRQDPFGMADKQYFSLDARAEYFNNRHREDSLNTWLVSLQPRIWAQYGLFQFHLGVNTSFELDSVSYFRAYPLFGAEANLVPGILVAHLGLSGQLEKHSLHSLTTANPFLNTSLGMKFMNTRSEVSGGIRGSLADFLSYKLTVRHASIDNYAFFVTDTTGFLGNQFTVVYDDIRRFHASGEVFARFHERFSTRLGLDYFQYGLTNEIEAWHAPTVQFSVNMKYNIQDKIILTFDGFTRNEAFARMFDTEGNPTAVRLHGTHLDANLGIEYRYTRLLSVFLQFNNLSNKPLDRWMNYPSQGFNFLGGLSYSF
jgi:hypothetical protein